jgi:UDP-3-O-[3-hydroxymyristoyl] glucosamine N-acyltransferase
MALSLQQLADSTGAAVYGDNTCLIHRAADIASAGEGDIAFVYTAKYAQYLQTTQASALVVNPALAEQCSVPALVSDDPRLTFAKIVALLYPVTRPSAGIAVTAVIHSSARVDDSAYIDSGAVIKAGARISAGAYIGANCVIAENVSIGVNTSISANTTVGHGCSVGDDCLLHSGVVIGADGFGFVKDGDHHFKVPQIGNVRIGNRVEIGASTTVDRGALGDTVIEDGVKIDNQIQIGHNVHVGHDTVISACTCVAGSTKIGAHCLIGGSVGIRDNIEIVDNTVITGRTFVSNAITEPGVYSSSTLMDTNENWRRNVARFKQLDAMARRLKILEKNANDNNDNNK